MMGYFSQVIKLTGFNAAGRVAPPRERVLPLEVHEEIPIPAVPPSPPTDLAQAESPVAATPVPPEPRRDPLPQTHSSPPPSVDRPVLVEPPTVFEVPPPPVAPGTVTPALPELEVQDLQETPPGSAPRAAPPPEPYQPHAGDRAERPAQPPSAPSLSGVLSEVWEWVADNDRPQPSPPEGFSLDEDVYQRSDEPLPPSPPVARHELSPKPAVGEGAPRKLPSPAPEEIQVSIGSIEVTLEALDSPPPPSTYRQPPPAPPRSRLKRHYLR